MEDKTPQQKITEESTKKRKEKCTRLTIEMLAHLLIKDLPYSDVHYVHQRALEILHKAIKKTDFHDKTIENLRRQLVEKSIGSIIHNIELKPKAEKQDETSARDERCEESAQKMATMLLKHEIIMNDLDYFKEIVADDDQYFMDFITRSFADTIYELLINSIDESIKRSNEKLWGVPKEKVSFRMIDNMLKS